jgi:predicted dehydrogenase
MLWSSQVALGNENGLKLRIYGSKGGLEWAQENLNYLWFTPHGVAKRLITRGSPAANPAAAAVSRIPAGHPEGYLGGFATIYTEAADAIRAVQSGTPRADAIGLLPGIVEGLEGMSFINACVQSSANNAAWTKL